MIRRLRVRGYKSLVDCSVELDPVTVILGPNGTGKSNLVDLIGLLSRLASKETVRESFEGHRGRPLEAFHRPRGFGQESYTSVLALDRLSFSVECDLDLQPGIVREVNQSLAQREKAVGASTTYITYTKVSETLLRYRVEIGLHPRSGELFVVDESLQALRHDLAPKAQTSRKPFVERERLEAGERFVARVERQSHPRYFDLDRPRTLLSELSDPVYHPHVVAAAREMASWRVYYVEPARMRTETPVQSADEPGRAGELLAAYYYYSLQQKRPAAFRGIVQNLKRLVPGLHDLRVDSPGRAPRDRQHPGRWCGVPRPTAIRGYLASSLLAGDRRGPVRAWLRRVRGAGERRQSRAPGADHRDRPQRCSRPS